MTRSGGRSVRGRSRERSRERCGTGGSSSKDQGTAGERERVES